MCCTATSRENECLNRVQQCWLTLISLKAYIHTLVDVPLKTIDKAMDFLYQTARKEKPIEALIYFRDNIENTARTNNEEFGE